MTNIVGHEVKALGFLVLIFLVWFSSSYSSTLFSLQGLFVNGNGCSGHQERNAAWRSRAGFGCVCEARTSGDWKEYRGSSRTCSCSSSNAPCRDCFFGNSGEETSGCGGILPCRVVFA
jgi:hypothetical protein